MNFRSDTLNKIDKIFKFRSFTNSNIKNLDTTAIDPNMSLIILHKTNRDIQLESGFFSFLVVNIGKFYLKKRKRASVEASRELEILIIFFMA